MLLLNYSLFLKSAGVSPFLGLTEPPNGGGCVLRSETKVPSNFISVATKWYRDKFDF